MNTANGLIFYTLVVKIPDVDDYAMSRLLQNSSVASAEAASTLLTYVTMALYNAEKEYVQVIEGYRKRNLIANPISL